VAETDELSGMQAELHEGLAQRLIAKGADPKDARKRADVVFGVSRSEPVEVASPELVEPIDEPAPVPAPTPVATQPPKQAPKPAPLVGGKAPEYLRPEFSLEMPMLLRDLQSTRERMISGQDQDASMTDRLVRHARGLGLDVDQFKQAAKRQNVALNYLVTEVGRKGRRSSDLVKEAQDRGSYAFLDAEQQAEYRSDRGKGKLDRSLIKYTHTGDDNDLLNAIGPIKTADEALTFWGESSDEDIHVSKEGEKVFKFATLITQAVMQDGEAAKMVDTWSEQWWGAEKYIDKRVQQYLKQKNITIGDVGAKAFEESERKYRQRAIRELVALKTSGMWSAPIIMSKADMMHSGKARTVSERFYDALNPTVELVGMAEVNGDATMVARQENPVMYLFNMVDMGQSLATGAIAEGEFTWEAAVEGLENRRNFFEASVDSEFANQNMATKSVAFVGGLGAAILTPDLMVFGGFAGKTARRLGDTITTNRSAKRAGELLSEIHVARRENRFEEASRLESVLRAEFPQKGGVADALDMLDVMASEFVSKGIPEMMDPAFAKSLKAVDDKIGRRMISDHPGLRKLRLKAGETGRPGKLMGTEYKGLYETDKILDQLKVARQRLIDEGTTDSLTMFRKTINPSMKKLSKLVDEAADPEGAEFIRRISDSLDDLIKDPHAWNTRFHGSKNLDNELRKLSALRGPTDEAIEAATGAAKKALQDERVFATARRKQIHDQIGIIVKHAREDVVDPLALIDRATEVVMGNNEARSLAAEYLRRAILKDRKIKPMNNLPKGNSGEMVELTTEGRLFSDKIADAFGLGEEQARSAARITDARARAWSFVTGRTVGEYYDTRFADIRKLGPSAQMPTALAAMARREAQTGWELEELADGLVEITSKEIRDAKGAATRFLGNYTSAETKLEGVVYNSRVAAGVRTLDIDGVAHTIYPRVVDIDSLVVPVAAKATRKISDRQIIDPPPLVFRQADGTYKVRDINEVESLKAAGKKQIVVDLAVAPSEAVDLGLTFKIEGDALTVKSSGIPSDMRGQGYGVELYLKAMDHAKSIGKSFASDLAPSPDAIAMYERLIERGMPIKRKIIEQDGKKLRQYVMSADDLTKADLESARKAAGDILYQRRTTVPEGTSLASVSESYVAPRTGWTGDVVREKVGLGNLTAEGAIDVMRGIKSGTELAEFIAKNADNPVHRSIAQRILPHLDDTDVHVLTGKADELPQFLIDSANKGDLDIGVFNTLVAMSAHESHLRRVTKGLNWSSKGEAFNDVFIRGVVSHSGATAETALHELVHAVTVRRLNDGNNIANKGTKLQAASSEIIGLRNQVVGIYNKASRDKSLDPEILNLLSKALQDQKEFVAYGLTNKQFQDYLMTVKVGNKSAWNTFVEKVANLLGISKNDQNVLSELLRATDELLDAPLGTLSARPYTDLISRMDEPIKQLGKVVDPRILKQQAEGVAKGAVEFMDDGRAIIYALKQPNFSTVIHEIGHVFRRDIGGDDLKVIEDWCGVADGKWTEIAEEKFARGFERYIAEGRAPNLQLKNVFAKMKVWMAEVYRSFVGTPLADDIPEEVSKILGKMLDDQPPNTPPLPRVLRAMSIGEAEKVQDDGIDAFQSLAEEARRLGMRNSAPDSIDSSLATNGKIVFKVEVLGKKVWTKEDIADLQVNLEQKARLGRQDKEPVEIALRSGQDVVMPQEMVDEKIFAMLGGEGAVRAAARAAVHTVLGGDHMGALRHLRPEYRHGSMNAARGVQQAYGDAISFVSESAKVKDGVEIGMSRLAMFLTGNKMKFDSGRDALSSGTDFLSGALDDIADGFEALTPATQEALRKMIKIIDDAGPDDINGGAMDAVAKGGEDLAVAVNSFISSSKSPLIFADLLKSWGVGAAAVKRPQEMRMIKLMLEASGAVPGRSTALEGVEKAAHLLDELELLYKREGALRAAVLFAGYGQARYAKQAWAGSGMAVDKKTYTFFLNWLNGEAIDPAMQPKMQAMARQFGLNPNMIDDMILDTKWYIPRAAREKIMEALSQGAKAVSKDGSYLNESNLRGAYGFFYRYMKTRMTRGGFMVRQRYFLMNTFDHFGQMAMVAGFRPALVSTIRMSTQNVMAAPGMAHLMKGIDMMSGKQASEAFRKSLQRGGEKMAGKVSDWLGVSKYHIEVNPILEGVGRAGETTFTVKDAKTGARKIYKYEDIRKVAVEEGIFASFDTRALENAIKKGVNLAETDYLVGLKNTPFEGILKAEQNVKQGSAFLTKIVSDTAEAWSERERIGAMVTLMEAGMEPRKAARLVIDGLYDYAGSMTKDFDRNVLINLMFPFWAFQKNANRHVLKMMFTPQGAYRMGVLRRGTDRGSEAITHLLYDRVAEPYGLDVESMPPDLQDTYYAMRKSVEVGYGPLELLKKTPQGTRIIEHIEESFGPLESLPPEVRERLEYGYGGVHRVPEDVKNAMQMYFAGVRTTGTDDLGNTGTRGQVMALHSLVSADVHALQPRSMKGDYTDKFDNYYLPKPSKSARRGYIRERAGFTVTLPMIEEVQKFRRMAENDPETGYKDVQLEVLLPDSTIYAGFRHIASVGALGMVAAQAIAGGSDQDQNLYDAGLRSIMAVGGDPLRAPIPAEIIDKLALGGIEGGASPRRLSPTFARWLRGATAMTGLPEPPVFIIPAKADTLNPGPDQIIDKERAYMQPGMYSLLFSTSPLGELNDMYLRWDKSPLEERAAIEGEMLRWARVLVGAQTVETSRVQSAKGELPRFMSVSTTPPRPK
jgi:predicted GNAT family acetyltransferase